MDRRCFGCASKFSLLKKELGCKSCGHSFCSGCLGFSAILPQCGNAKQKVCKKCHDNISSGGAPKNNPAKWSPPENYKKRIAALEAKQSKKDPGLPQTGPSSRYQGLLPEDRAIAERLDRLKQETKPKTVSSTAEIESRLEALRKHSQHPVPSVQEMEDRLAVLQGTNPPSRAPRPVYQPPDTRTPTQKADDLLSQLTDKVAIDQRWEPAAHTQEFSTQPMNDLSRVDGTDSWTEHNSELNSAYLEEEKRELLAQAAAELREENTRSEKILDIAKRLAALQGRDPDTVTKDSYTLPDSDEETDEAAIQRVLGQLSEEAVLDEASGFNIPPNQNSGTGSTRQAGKILPPKMVPAQPSSTRAPLVSSSRDSDEEELPWCCICNEDAILRCHDCDNDLYCRRCFREGHNEFDLKEHRTSSYRPPQKKRER
ncbi:abscission/NoCut checkpoint regulator isoform X1 [Pelobates fuscus]|uniref:abscission/NoCut checkpoint regulator isoform X1 n=1 Tax=Pelobates fuscus TaxID=191477 RepID=UPI002FE4BE74